tara:strand:- start:269 stop:385 length:117 start_codon:yes stop_codon:yes gene_type:complete
MGEQHQQEVDTLVVVEQELLVLMDLQVLVALEELVEQE